MKSRRDLQNGTKEGVNHFFLDYECKTADSVKANSGNNFEPLRNPQLAGECYLTIPADSGRKKTVNRKKESVTGI